MKREDLKALGLTDEQIDKIMAIHGQDVEKFKAESATAKAEAESAKAQLTEATKQIEGFKSLDIDGVKKAADEWKTKAEAAQAEAIKQVAALKFDHALESALTGAKAKNAKTVKALLNTEQLKFNDADGSILGLKEQLEKIKSENDFLFESTVPTPKIVTGGNSQTVINDPVILAARRAAGLGEGK